MEKGPRFGIFRNWLSLAGIVLAAGGLFSFLLLFVVDSLAHFSNPYVGVLTYLVAPSFLFLGVVLCAGGILWRRWRRKRAHEVVPKFQIDLGRLRDRRLLGFFLAGSLVFLLVTALALMLTIDRTLNSIWRVRTPRSIAQRVLVYWGAVTLGPLLLAAACAGSARTSRRDSPAECRSGRSRPAGSRTSRGERDFRQRSR